MSSCFIARGSQPGVGCGVPVMYMSEGLSHWIMATGALPLLLPALPGERSCLRVADLLDCVDGLVLQGGVDVSPASYGEEPQHDDWAGDPRRDAYELALVRECRRQGKPILGVCRGMQVLNVALGGTLHQDIEGLCDGRVCHRDLSCALEVSHRVEFVAGGWLDRIYGPAGGGAIISIHHQAVRKLGSGLVVEARSADDGLIEALRLEGDGYAVGIQWHPELQPLGASTLLDPMPIIEDFCRAARSHRDMITRGAGSSAPVAKQSAWRRELGS